MTLATLTINADDILGANFNDLRTSAYIEANVPVIVVDGDEVRVGGRREKPTSGTITFADLVTTDSASNPASFEYRITLVYTPVGGRKQETLVTGWFPFTASANLAAIPEAWDDFTAPPSWRSEFVAQSEALLAQQESLADLDTTDAAVAYSMEFGATAPDYLSATIEAAAGARSGADAIAAQTTDPNLLRVTTRGATALAIPTYVATNDETTHASVYYNPNGWNGYRWWMAHTPYTAADNQVENPSLAVSNDGETWIDAPGVTNPLEPSPGLPGYNSDTELTMGPDGTLHLFWRTAYNPSEFIYHRSSTDGVTWTPKVAIITSNILTRRPVSPCVIFDGQTWHMWAIDMIPSPNTVLHWTHEGDPSEPWTDTPDVCDMAAPAGRDPWHLGVQRTPSGEFHAALQDSDLGANGENSDIYFLTSRDPVTGWTRATKPLIKRHGTATSRWDRSLYRPSLVPIERDGKKGYAIYYGSSVPAWYIGKAEAFFESATDVRAAELFKGQAKLTPYMLADIVNRADSATTPNPSSAGLAYTVTSGTLGVSGAALYAPTAGNNKGMFDAGAAAHEISAEYPTLGTPTFLICRYVDESNFIRAGVSGGNWLIAKIVGGVATTVATTSGGGNGANGDALRLRASGNTISLYVNDVLQAEGTVTEGNTATKVAVYAQDITTRIRNVLIRRL